MHTDIKKPDFADLSKVHAEDYLAGLQALAFELDAAMEALVSNALRSFEESLVRQRSLCERLAKLSRSLASVNGGDVALERIVDAGLAERITDASGELFRLNNQYSALLKHSGDTLRIFAGLFRTYSAVPARMLTSERISLQNWSCEL